MGRQCFFPGCKNTSGLHSFPANLEIRQQWVHALGLPNHELPPRAGVCNQHFSQDCFSNFMEVEMGFSKVLILKASAVPNTAQPQDFGCTLSLKLEKDDAAQQDSGGTQQLNVKQEGGQDLAVSQHSGCTPLLNVQKEEEAGENALLLQHSTSMLPLKVKEEGEDLRLPQDPECKQVLNVKEEGQDGTLTLELNIEKEGGKNDTLSPDSGSALPFQPKEKKDEVRVPVLTTRPPPPQQQQLVLITNLRHIQPKPIREMGCQTERVLTKHCFVQADSKPYRRSKAIQAHAPHRSVPCDTDELGADFKCVRMGLPPFKRPRCEELSDPGNQGEVKGSTDCTSFSCYQYN
ncbi:uncharacterized protein LOC115431015 isoform X2 [Sphaeramia orbicularis]|uniref:uncharacterized protein LOC115431015 isoform X2 n=1 Tax=Sphaeramia orbicularis TaxID=375764 RepID=UPI00117BF940|nr:uncharacterized protein LOC115431015 isoform X2 [Sphaeramia orbicularis]